VKTNIKIIYKEIHCKGFIVVKRNLSLYKKMAPLLNFIPHSKAHYDRLLHEIYICVGTILYGLSVVIAKDAMDIGVGPYTFNALQHIVGVILLFIVRKKLKRLTSNKDKIVEDDIDEIKTPQWQLISDLQIYFPQTISRSPSFELIALGTMVACCTYVASTFNQIGLMTVSAGKSSFLTSLYVVLTPLMQYFFLSPEKSGVTYLTWCSAVISMLGSYFLSGSMIDGISWGEFVTIMGAVVYAIGILITDHSVDRVSPVDLTCVQMFVSMILCIITAIILEPDGIIHLVQAPKVVNVEMLNEVEWSWVLIIVGGIIEAVAFQLETIGQLHTTGPRAALLMSLDSVVTVAAAYLFLNEILSNIEILGCILMLSATLVVSSNEETQYVEEVIEKSLHSVERQIDHLRHSALDSNK
jgi:drug/metabolite transporter (DMT)-like permease